MLKGFIFDYNGEHTPDQYIWTMKEIVTYIRRTNNKYTGHFIMGVQTLTLANPVKLTAPDPASQVQFKMWKLDIKDHQLKVQEFENFRAGLYTLVMGQCMEAMQDQLQSHHNFPAADKNGITLLIIIRSLIHTFEE